MRRLVIKTKRHSLECTPRIWLHPDGVRFRIFKWDGHSVSVSPFAMGLFFFLLLTLRFGLLPFFYSGLDGGSYWWMSVLTAVGVSGSLFVHRSYLAHPNTRWTSARLVVHYLSALSMNLLLAALFGGLALLADLHARNPVVGGVFFHLSMFNILLVTLELLPALPLDGGKILLALSKGRAGWAGKVAEFLLWLGLFASVLLVTSSGYQFLAGRPFVALWLWVAGFALAKGSVDAFGNRGSA